MVLEIDAVVRLWAFEKEFISKSIAIPAVNALRTLFNQPTEWEKARHRHCAVKIVSTPIRL